ncbi:MAG: hypothetical protein ACFBRM_10345 [Pikeienuella sp.]
MPFRVSSMPFAVFDTFAAAGAALSAQSFSALAAARVSVAQVRQSAMSLTTAVF